MPEGLTSALRVRRRSLCTRRKITRLQIKATQLCLPFEAFVDVDL